MSNYYVIDTNIILKDPYFYRQLKDSKVIIPPIVLQELDGFKKDNELNLNVRIFSRYLDKIYEAEYKDSDYNIIFFIPFRLPEESTLNLLGAATPDNIIIECAYYFDKIYNDVKLISNDILVRTKARGVGLNALDLTYIADNNISDDIYSGYKEVSLDGNLIDRLYLHNFISIDYIKEINYYPHMFIILKDFYSKKSAIAKINEDCTKIQLCQDLPPIWGITAKNVKQKMALRLLMDPDIPLVTLRGKAGTGKTLLTLASALLMVNDENIYDKLILTKPTIAVSKDIGYLPGSKDEKLNPWLQSYYDNLETLLDGHKYAEDLEQLKVEIDALTYIRGRSLPKRFFVIDEAQNLNKNEVKTIITRIGEGSKIVLLGDPDQIDIPHLDIMNNGLTYVINKFKDQSVAGHITLDKSERSKLSEIAANIL